MFRVDRIKEMTVTDETFEPPEGFDAAGVASGPLFVPSSHDVEVTLDLAPAAGWVREITPHDRADPLPDGWTRMILRTAHFEWLARLVLRLGDDVRIVDPPELAQRVRETAMGALERYGA